MGPRFASRGYRMGVSEPSRRTVSFNGSTAREPWYRSEARRYTRWCQRASMGPRLASRGYRTIRARHDVHRVWSFNGSTVREPWLSATREPSPASQTLCFNGSTVREPWYRARARYRSGARAIRFNGSTVREPWLSRRCVMPGSATGHRLQWVHGSRTVVIGRRCEWPAPALQVASMGPRFASRGYRRRQLELFIDRPRRFNGSTVREPWYRPDCTGCRSLSDARFNGSTVREPWLSMSCDATRLDES